MGGALGHWTPNGPDHFSWKPAGQMAGHYFRQEFLGTHHHNCSYFSLNFQRNKGSEQNK